MKTKKMSLANIQGKLSRAEMKKIMAGSGDVCFNYCRSNADCGPTCGSCEVDTNWSNGKFCV